MDSCCIASAWNATALLDCCVVCGCSPTVMRLLLSSIVAEALLKHDIAIGVDVLPKLHGHVPV